MGNINSCLLRCHGLDFFLTHRIFFLLLFACSEGKPSTTSDEFSKNGIPSNLDGSFETILKDRRVGSYFLSIPISIDRSLYLVIENDHLFSIISKNKG